MSRPRDPRPRRDLECPYQDKLARAVYRHNKKGWSKWGTATRRRLASLDAWHSVKPWMDRRNPSPRRTAKIEHALHRASKANHWYSGSKPRRRFRKWVKAKNRFKSRTRSPRAVRAMGRRNPNARRMTKILHAAKRSFGGPHSYSESSKSRRRKRKWHRALTGGKSQWMSARHMRARKRSQRRNPSYSSAALPYARKGWDAFDRPGSSWRIADCPYHTGWQREAWQSGAWDRRNNKPRP